MPDICHDCGGFTNGEELGSYYWKNTNECTCIRCPDCEVVMGNSLEDEWWNNEQADIHKEESPACAIYA